MSKESKNSIVWFISGMLVQILGHIVAKTNYMLHPVWFCAAFGFIMLIAVVTGMLFEGCSKPKKTTNQMTYEEIAELEHLHGGEK